MLTTITRLRCYGMACGSVDGWVGGWVDGDDGLSLPVPVRLPSRSCVWWCRHTRAGLQTFSFAAAEAGRTRTRAAGYCTAYRLQHATNNAIME